MLEIEIRCVKVNRVWQIQETSIADKRLAVLIAAVTIIRELGGIHKVLYSELEWRQDDDTWERVIE